MGQLLRFTSTCFTFQVSAFSTWEKELHKIVFDSRYLLLNMKERKQCFEKFVRSRADEERRERKVKAKEKKEEYKKFIQQFVTSERLARFNH